MAREGAYICKLCAWWTYLNWELTLEDIQVLINHLRDKHGEEVPVDEFVVEDHYNIVDIGPWDN